MSKFLITQKELIRMILDNKVAMSKANIPNDPRGIVGEEVCYLALYKNENGFDAVHNLSAIPVRAEASNDDVDSTTVTFAIESQDPNFYILQKVDDVYLVGQLEDGTPSFCSYSEYHEIIPILEGESKGSKPSGKLH